MKKIFFLFIFFLSFTLLKGQNQNIIARLILKDFFESIIESDVKLIKKYKNKEMIKEISNASYQTLKNRGSLDTIQNKEKLIERLCNDTIEVEGYKFLDSQITKILRKSHNRKLDLKNNKFKNHQDDVMMISKPIISVDKKIAMIYVQISCGALCGSKTIYVFHFTNGKWIFKDLLLRSVS